MNQYLSHVGVGTMYLGLGGQSVICQRGEGIRQGHTECLTSPALSLAAFLAAEARSPTDALSSFATSVSCVSRRAEDECCGSIKQRTLVSLFADLVLGALEGLRGRVDAARDGFGGRVGVIPDQCQ